MMGDVTYPVDDTYGVFVMRRRHAEIVHGGHPLFWAVCAKTERDAVRRCASKPSNDGSGFERRVQVQRLCQGRGGHAMGIRIGSVLTFGVF